VNQFALHFLTAFFSFWKFQMSFMIGPDGLLITQIAILSTMPDVDSLQPAKQLEMEPDRSNAGNINALGRHVEQRRVT
jgi:hypothetical protein